MYARQPLMAQLGFNHKTGNPPCVKSTSWMPVRCTCFETPHATFRQSVPPAHVGSVFTYSGISKSTNGLRVAGVIRRQRSHFKQHRQHPNWLPNFPPWTSQQGAGSRRSEACSLRLIRSSKGHQTCVTGSACRSQALCRCFSFLSS